MARKKTTAPTPADSPLRQLALEFFGLFGAAVRPDGAAALTVDLTPELTAHFGKPTLSLVFSTAELSPYHDLVAYGSRVFERMMTYIANHGSMARAALPSHFPELAVSRLPGELTLAGCDLTHSAGKRGWRHLIQFNFHISYRADDKREEIFSAALDEDGAAAPNMNDLLAQATGAGADEVPPEAAPSTASETEPHPASETEPQVAADTEPDASSEATPKTPRKASLKTSLSMEGLIALAQRAQELALFHADQQCGEIERDILPRLHAILSRLVTYYEQQALEIQERSDDPDYAGNQRQALRADLQRKIAEEIENHRLRVAVTLFSLVQVLEPTWDHALTLRSKADGTILKLPLTRNLSTGKLTMPVCHACDLPTAVIAVCAHEHVSCPTCLAHCHACARDICLECGVQGCTVCKQMLCQDCAVTCPACGQWACHEHTARCLICQETTCFTCQDTCAQCEVRQCKTHLVADYLAPGALLCANCAVVCPHCQRASRQTALCDFCGQIFCQGCTGACSACGKVYCRPHLLTDRVSGALVCKRCAAPCPHCGLETASLTTCAVCGVTQCASCLQGCAECGTMVCAEHRERCSLCGRFHCEQHSDRCHMDGKTVCIAHSFACPVCGDTVCHAHQKFCVVCSMAYCPDCINLDNSVCATCQQLEDAAPINLAQEPVAHDPDVATLATAYTWRSARNRAHTVYFGTRLMGQMTLVVRHDGMVVHTSHVKGLESLIRWGRRLLG